MQPYNLEYHKYINRSSILPNVLKGARNGVYGQFIADMVISFFLYEEDIFIKDIKISNVAAYYAAIASGMLESFLSIYMDPFAIALFSTITYTMVFEIMEYVLYQEDIEMPPEEIIFDALVSIFIIYSFDPIAHKKYLIYQQKRQWIEPTIQQLDRSPAQNIFIIILINTYSFLKLQRKL